MATSRSVAAIVSRSSDAVSFTHCRTGLGVRAATTLPVTVNASSNAPRLQITFMVRQPFLCRRTTGPSCPPAASGDSTDSLPRGYPGRAGTLTLLLYQTKLKESSSRDDDWRILDNSAARNATAASDGSWRDPYRTLRVDNVSKRLSRSSHGSRPPAPRAAATAG